MESRLDAGTPFEGTIPDQVEMLIAMFCQNPLAFRPNIVFGVLDISFYRSGIMLNAWMALAQTETDGSLFGLLIYLVIVVVIIAGMWKMFKKANQPGWGALIPIYNFILLLKVAGKPVWWIILMLIPLVNIVISIMVYAAVAKNFGRGVGFTLGLIFLPFVFFPILGFGEARYNPVAAPAI